MNVELQTRLIESHPSIFREAHGDPKYTCMAWGIECPDEWYDTIELLCSTIDSHVEGVNRLFPNLKFAVVAAQVKEKFHGLRFYVDYLYANDLELHDYEKLHRYMDQVTGMITMAERMIDKGNFELRRAMGEERPSPFSPIDG